MQTVILDLQYLPSVAYFCIIKKAPKVLIEAHENFVKQTYRNRCRIMTANKVLDLSIPVSHGNRKVPIQKLAIDHQQKWKNNHWRAIESAYRNAPFYEYYYEKIKQVLYGDDMTLFGLNRKLLTICLKYLQIDTPIHFTTAYQENYDKPVLDLRSAIHPKKGVNTLSWFVPQSYHQVFGKDFVSNLSIIDLLFCEGPGAARILQASFDSG